MTRTKCWTLTDVAGDLWIDSFSVGNEALRLPTPHDWSVRKYTLRGGLRDGVDVVEVHNGALSFAVLPTRGMGLWRGAYRGQFLGWRSPVRGPVHPHFVNLTDHGGLGWLAGFDEWVVRCGLASNGPPGEDVVTHKDGRTTRTPLTLHGRIANRPAHFVEVRVNLDPPYEISVVGHVAEAGLFLPHLHLTTTTTTIPGSNRLVIHDVVENRAAQPAEMQMLYHVNVGPPFLEAGSRVLAPLKEMAPLTKRAAEGIDTYETYAGPTTGFAEQVYGYDLLANSHGRTLGAADQAQRPTAAWRAASAAANCRASSCGRTRRRWRMATSPEWNPPRTIRTSRRSTRQQGRAHPAARRTLGGDGRAGRVRHAARGSPGRWQRWRRYRPQAPATVHRSRHVPGFSPG